MRRSDFRGSFFSLIVFAAVAHSSHAEEPLPSVKKVRDLLMPGGGQVALGEDGKPLRPNPLLKFGDKLFPAYETIISDPDSDPAQVSNALSYIIDIKADRARFIPLAVDRLTDSTSGVRRAALELLGEIGSERNTTPIVALLSDENTAVRRDAARVLGKIGGKRDLVAIDIWLKTGNYRNDKDQVQILKASRDAIEKRLKETPKDKK